MSLPSAGPTSHTKIIPSNIHRSAPTSKTVKLLHTHLAPVSNVCRGSCRKVRKAGWRKRERRGSFGFGNLDDDYFGIVVALVAE